MGSPPVSLYPKVFYNSMGYSEKWRNGQKKVAGIVETDKKRRQYRELPQTALTKGEK
jgi:hypothetical protein